MKEYEERTETIEQQKALIRERYAIFLLIFFYPFFSICQFTVSTYGPPSRH